MRLTVNLMNLESAVGIDEFNDKFIKFCQSNNFKTEEMNYLWNMFDVFCGVNKTIPKDS